MTRAQRLKDSVDDRAHYRRNIETKRAQARLRKQRFLIQRAIDDARIELGLSFSNLSATPTQPGANS